MLAPDRRLVLPFVLKHLGKVAHVDHVTTGWTPDEVVCFAGRRPSLWPSHFLKR